MSAGAHAAVSGHDFHARMSAFAPFERAPHLAVAVSGGSDSMALVHLAADWCRTHGGRVTALTVNHGLRPDMDAEIEQVSAWLSGLGVPHAVLPWVGPKPGTGIQQAARDNRYRLMEAWCRDHRVLHLLVGHTFDDQAETYLMRLRRQSGADGLAAMASVRELTSCRLLRPLLDTRREALRDYLRDRGQDWIEDPSNEDARFGRVAVRRLIAAGEFSTARLCGAAEEHGRMRCVAEGVTDQFLARHARLHQAGFLRIDRKVVAEASDDTALRALGRSLASIGGANRPPRDAMCRAVLNEVRGHSTVSRTLGGCRVYTDAGDLLICREARHLPAARQMDRGEGFIWDHRIAVRVGTDADAGLSIRTATTADWTKTARGHGEFDRWRRLPRPVRESLPVVAGPSGVFSAPLLTYNFEAPGVSENGQFAGVEMSFYPRRPLSFAAFCVAKRE